MIRRREPFVLRGESCLVTSRPLSECNDDELMPLLQRNDLGALETLYERHHRLALALARRVVGDQEAAEEVVQESFLAAWQRSATYRPERGRARDWLLSIVRHRAIDRIRRGPRPGQMTELDDTLVDRRTPEPWWEVDQRLRREGVLEVMERLPPAQREAIELAYYGGLTQQEIAERVGVPLGTVKGRMRLAMEKLRLGLAKLAPDLEAAE
jgi:RNA polymerase sigma-70 factor (ECF subfamily)